MIRRDSIEQHQSYVSPTPEKAIHAQTADGTAHIFYPTGEEDGEITGHLTSIDPETGEATYQPVNLPNTRLMESKDFIVRHRTGEIVAAVSLGAIVTGSLIVRHLRKRK